MRWLALGLALSLTQPALADPGPSDRGAAEYFGNTVLVDQDGEQHRFYSDLIEGKIVIINSFFSTCEGACPVTTQSMAAVQEAVGDRVGKDVVILSISVDPKIDTSEKLKAFADKYDAQPGWYFLTGPKPNVDAVLGRLGLDTQTREAHKNLILVGNTHTGLWKKAFALGPTAEVVDIVRSVVDDTGE